MGVIILCISYQNDNHISKMCRLTMFTPDEYIMWSMEMNVKRSKGHVSLPKKDL